MVYSQLVQAIQDYIENSEITFVANVDLLIEIAEKKIYRASDLNVARKYEEITLPADAKLVSLPADVVIVRSVQYDSDPIAPGVPQNLEFLLQKDPSYIEDMQEDFTPTGIPRYYAHYDATQLLIFPPTTANAVLHIAYTERPEQISDTNIQTWLSLNAPDVLLYGCLLEAARFIKDESDIFQMYEKQFGEAFKGMLMEENLRNRTDVYREREIKMGG